MEQRLGLGGPEGDQRQQKRDFLAPTLFLRAWLGGSPRCGRSLAGREGWVTVGAAPGNAASLGKCAPRGARGVCGLEGLVGSPQKGVLAPAGPINDVTYLSQAGAQPSAKGLGFPRGGSHVSHVGTLAKRALRLLWAGWGARQGKMGKKSTISSICTVL